MTRSQAPSLSDPPPRSQRAGAGSQGGRSVSLPAPSIKDEEELKSMPKPPVGETDREMPAILLNDTEEPVDNGEETDSGGAVDSGQWGVDGDGTADNRSPPVPDDSEEGYSPSSSSQPSTLNPQPPMTSDSPWTESALMILATVSTLSFLCMLYIADVYRRRWLNALMSQNGLLPGTLPPFGSQNSRTLQDGFYEFPFSTHYDEN